MAQGINYADATYGAYAAAKIIPLIALGMKLRVLMLLLKNTINITKNNNPPPRLRAGRD